VHLLVDGHLGEIRGDIVAALGEGGDVLTQASIGSPPGVVLELLEVVERASAI